MQPTAAEVGEKSDVSIRWKTIGSRYAKPQAGDRRFRLAGNLSDCFREAMIETTRGMEQEGEEEGEKRWWNSRRSRKWEESGGDTTEIKKKRKKGESKPGTRERSQRLMDGIVG